MVCVPFTSKSMIYLRGISKVFQNQGWKNPQKRKLPEGRSAWPGLEKRALGGDGPWIAVMRKGTWVCPLWLQRLKIGGGGGAGTGGWGRSPKEAEGSLSLEIFQERLDGHLLNAPHRSQGGSDSAVSEPSLTARGAGRGGTTARLTNARSPRLSPPPRQWPWPWGP